jgi:hypothetical protein
LRPMRPNPLMATLTDMSCILRSTVHRRMSAGPVVRIDR